MKSKTLNVFTHSWLYHITFFLIVWQHTVILSMNSNLKFNKTN